MEVPASRAPRVALGALGLLLAALTLGRLAWAVERAPSTAGRVGLATLRGAIARH